MNYNVVLKSDGVKIFFCSFGFRCRWFSREESESQRARSKREDTEGGAAGMKLELQRGPVEFLVVDHIEHVNEN
jgi:hypothetical protein